MKLFMSVIELEPTALARLSCRELPRSTPSKPKALFGDPVGDLFQVGFDEAGKLDVHYFFVVPVSAKA